MGMGKLTKTKTKRMSLAKIGKKAWQYRWMYVFLLPAVIWYILFAYLPIYGVTIAFKDYNIVKGVWDSPWVGFANFTKIFNDPNFTRAFRNTIFISLLKLIFVITLRTGAGTSFIRGEKPCIQRNHSEFVHADTFLFLGSHCLYHDSAAFTDDRCRK